MDEDADAPRIIAFRLDNQLRGDPWTLIFATTFTDASGDLGSGQAHFYLNSSMESTPIGLADVFVQSALAPDAKRGTLAIPLRFGDELSDGARVRLSLQLVDSRKKRSNCYSLDLRFSVDAVAATQQGETRPVWQARSAVVPCGARRPPRLRENSVGAGPGDGQGVRG